MLAVQDDEFSQSDEISKAEHPITAPIASEEQPDQVAKP